MGPQRFQPSKEDFEIGKMWYEVVEKLPDEKKIRVHMIKIERSGLQGVFDGMQQRRKRAESVG